MSLLINPYKYVSQEDDLTAGLLGHWKMDDGSGVTATDETANSNDGTLTNGPTWTTAIIGTDAVSLDGSNDIIDFATPSFFNPGSANFSVCLAINAGSTSQDCFVQYGHETGGAARLWALWFWNDDLRLYIDGTLASFNSTGTTPGADSANHYVVLTRSGNRFRVWLDDTVEIDVTNAVGSIDGVSDEKLTIGAEFSGGTSYTRHTQIIVDDFRIYDRALTSSEITTLSAQI